ncbi:hypothetical protein BS17DRAFT_783760 [Gyrodon lividus]|nr:hypothetical protein BS17DRAFT_783760 [Gyrodon lividus]
MKLKFVTALAVAASIPPLTIAGPIAYAICQTGCNTLAVACYAGAGFTFGVTVVGAPAAIVACNFALGKCMTACALTALPAPIP